MDLPRAIFRATGTRRCVSHPALAPLNGAVLFRALFPVEPVPGDLLELVQALDCAEFADIVLALRVEQQDCSDRIDRALARLRSNDN
jgi:hypothetical protein